MNKRTMNRSVDAYHECSSQVLLRTYRWRWIELLSKLGYLDTISILNRWHCEAKQFRITVNRCALFWNPSSSSRSKSPKLRWGKMLIAARSGHDPLIHLRPPSIHLFLPATTRSSGKVQPPCVDIPFVRSTKLERWDISIRVTLWQLCLTAWVMLSKIRQIGGQ